MSLHMRIAFGCHLVAALLLSIFGVVYLLRPEFMPYHADVVGRPWSAVEPAFQVLILALMRVVGGALLANALAIFILLFVPFRQGYRWACWAIPTIGLMASIPALLVTLYVAQNTPASPPWITVLVGILLLGLGLLLSVGIKVNQKETRTVSASPLLDK